jgi:hypothetical protein
MPPPTTITATTIALATTTTKVNGDVWVSWQLLAAAGEDGWWQQISSSLSADFFNGRFLMAYLRLINLKGTFSVLAGSCWRTKKRLHFFWGPFSIQLIIFFVFVFSFSLFQRIGSENAVEGSLGVNLVDSLPKVHSKVR